MSFDLSTTSRTQGRVTAGERYRELRERFYRVVNAYVSFRSYALVCATNPDPDPIASNKRFGTNLSHYCCDVEMRTQEALVGEPRLQEVWFHLAQEKPVDSKLGKQVIERCGRYYVSVDPSTYFARRGL